MVNLGMFACHDNRLSQEYILSILYEGKADGGGGGGGSGIKYWL